MINNIIRYGCNACSINPYGCNTCNYFSTFGTSRARWCCGGDPDSIIDHRALLYTTDTLTAAAGAAIPFNASSMTGAFTFNTQNQLVILQAGIYQATYTVNIPSGASADTTLSLRLNGIVLPSSQITVSHTESDGSVTITGQAIFSAAYAATMDLYTSNALMLAGANTGDVLASLVITTL